MSKGQPAGNRLPDKRAHIAGIKRKSWAYVGSAVVFFCITSASIVRSSDASAMPGCSRSHWMRPPACATRGQNPRPPACATRGQASRPAGQCPTSRAVLLCITIPIVRSSDSKTPCPAASPIPLDAAASVRNARPKPSAAGVQRADKLPARRAMSGVARCFLFASQLRRSYAPVMQDAIPAAVPIPLDAAASVRNARPKPSAAGIATRGQAPARRAMSGVARCFLFASQPRPGVRIQ